MATTPRAFVFLLALLAWPAWASAEETRLPSESEPAEPAEPAALSAEEHAARREELWQAILLQRKLWRTVLATDDTPTSADATPNSQFKVLLRRFIADYPENDNPRLGLARSLLEQSRKGIPKDKLLMLDFDALRNQSEGFGLRLLWGGMNAGLEMKVYTFRHDYLVVDFLRIGATAGISVAFDFQWDVWAGPSVGAQFQAGPDPRNEIRLLGGLAGGIMTKNVTAGKTEDDEEPASGIAYGPFLMFEFCYVRHFKQHLSLETGLEVLVPLWAPGPNPSPVLTTFIGFKL